jgi:hypothetical protein
MSTYQAVAGSAVAATPATTTAPPILKSNATAQPAATSGDPYSGLSGDNPLGLPKWLTQFLQQLGIGDTQIAHDPHLDYWFDDVLAKFLQNFGVNWNPAAGTVNGATYDSYADPSQAIYYVVRALEVFEDLQQFGTFLVQNPVEAFQYLVSLELFDWPFHLEEIGIFLSQNPAIFALAAPALAPLAAAGAAGLAGLAAVPPPPAATPVPVLALPPAVLPAVGASPSVSGVAGTAPGTSTTPSSAPATSTVTGSAPPAPPPAGGGGAGFAPPYVVGGPTIGASMGLQAKTQEPTSRGASKAPVAAAAVAAAAGSARSRRRRRAKQRDHSDEFADMNIDVDPDWGAPSTEASDQGAGNLGFAGTLSKGSEKASGLATISGDEFGGGPSMPMLPGTWSPDAPQRDGQHN